MGRLKYGGKRRDLWSEADSFELTGAPLDGGGGGGGGGSPPSGLEEGERVAIVDEPWITHYLHYITLHYITLLSYFVSWKLLRHLVGSAS